MTQEELKLYNELKKEISKANSRLARLEKFTGKPYSWAAQDLYDVLSVEKLNAWSKSNKIRINKEMSEEQLKRIMWATKEFLNKRTSTITGIKKRIKNVKAGFQYGIGVTAEQAEHIWRAFEDDLVKWALRYYDPSEFWALIHEAIETNMSEQRFTEEFIKRANIVEEIDADFRDLVHQLYKQEVLR